MDGGGLDGGGVDGGRARKAPRDAVSARWTTALLVCGKCSRKLGGGFGAKGRTPLAKLLRARADGKGRKAAFGVIETGCLKLCPKGAVVAIDARRPDLWLLVRPGDPIEEVFDRLGLGQAVRHAIPDEASRCVGADPTPIADAQPR